MPSTVVYSDEHKNSSIQILENIAKALHEMQAQLSSQPDFILTELGGADGDGDDVASCH